MKNKMKLKIWTASFAAALVLASITPTAVSAATWNGVSGVSDVIVNSITQYENEAASYQGQIDSLTWSINQNQGTISVWQANLALAKAATASGDKMNIWYGREAECQQAIDSNTGPMQQRINERAGLQAAQNQAYANANSARAQADAQAKAIWDEQNKPKPKPPVDPIKPVEPPVTPPPPVKPTEPEKPVTPPPSEPEDKPSTKPDEPNKPSEKPKPEEKPDDKPAIDEKPGAESDGKDKEDNDVDEKPSEPVKPPTNNEEAGDIVEDNQDEIKDDLNDFDHTKNIDELIKENEDGTYTVTEDALKRAILDNINESRRKAGLDPVEVSDGLVNFAAAKAQDVKDQHPLGESGHSNSANADKELDIAEKLFREKYYDVAIIDDLAVFQSDFDSRKIDSVEAAEKYARNMAESIAGEYGGWMTDDHKYDMLNPFAKFANLALTSSVYKYTDVWTGEEKDITIWYLAYVYTTGQEKE